MQVDFNTKTTYDDDDKYIKLKLKTYKDSITTNFYNKSESEKIPEEKVPHKCLCVIILVHFFNDSIIYAYEKYHPQIFLDEFKYMKKKIKTKNYIDNELESKSDIDTDTNTENDVDIDIEDSNNNKQIF